MDDAPREAARRFLTDGEAGLAAALSGTDPVALGWALKAECYEAWNTAPPRARIAAACLQALAMHRPGDAELRALADWTAGIGALTEGGMTDALEALQRAQAGFMRQGRDDLAAQTQVPQLMALAILGRYDEALRCGEEALARFVASGDERAAGRVETNLGTLLSQQDRHAEAAGFHRRAGLRFARARDVEQSIVADINLANALAWQFDLDEALLISERARMRADARGYKVLSALAWGSIGRLELHRGRNHLALPAMARACRGLIEADVAPQRIAEAEAALADAYLSVNLLPEAVALYEQVIERCARTDALAEQAWASLQRAQACAQLGDEAAAAGFEAARALFEQLGNAACVAIARLRLATLGVPHDPAAALVAARALAVEFARQGLRGLELEAGVVVAAALRAGGSLDASHAQYAATLAAAAGLAGIELQCLQGLGRVDMQRGRRSDATAWLEQAAARLEARRATLPGDEFRTAAGLDAQAVHDALVLLAIEEGAAPLVWQRIEASRARALRAGVLRGETATREDGDLRARLHGSRELEQQALAGGDAAGAARWAERARAIESELLEAHRRSQLARAATPTPALDAGAAPATELAAGLADDQLLVAYYLVGDRLLACVVDRERTTHHDWRVPGLVERMESLHFQLHALRGGAQRLSRHADQLLGRTRAHLQALYRLCWEPLAARVGARRRLIVLPHRRLHYLPFAALHDGEAWLVDRHEIELSPSAAIWQEAGRWRTGRCERVLAVGVGGPALPQVRHEIDAVAAAFGAGATTLRDAQATVAALRGAVHGADVVHLACHGQFRADSPYFSSLSLADGTLTLRDAAALPLTAGLVTLSACETALSRVAPGDELIGLVRGFLLAGVPSVVASHWTVDDASTAALMADFYAGLRAGQGPAAALAAAQRRLAGQGAHPFHWAAFAVHGRG